MGEAARGRLPEGEESATDAPPLALVQGARGGPRTLGEVGLEMSLKVGAALVNKRRIYPHVTCPVGPP
eukprot:362592-Pyramimonas_sp.AAC.2